MNRLPAGWSIERLDKYIHIKHGYAFKGEFFTNQGTHIVLTPGNFHEEGGFRFREGKCKYYSGHIPQDYILKRNDLIVAMTEQGEGLLGSTAIVPLSDTYLHNQRLGLITEIDPQAIHKRFLYYLFNSTHIRQRIRATANGAKVRHTSPSRIYEIVTPVPPISSQYKIASILSAYDDLIENNTRRIQILEEMTRMLYREWFVEFRFPGYKEQLDKPRKFPSQWKISNIRNIASFVGRGISPTYDQTAEGVVINQKCIRNRHLNMEFARRQTKPVPLQKEIRFGDILINSTGVGTLGRVAQVYQDLSQCTVDSHVTIVRPSSSVNIDYIGFALLELESYFESLGVGSTGQTELARERIADTELCIPARSIQDHFSDIVRPMRLQAMVMHSKNQNLRMTRDLLLPKLICGELDVTDLDVDIGEA